MPPLFMKIDGAFFKFNIAHDHLKNNIDILVFSDNLKKGEALMLLNIIVATISIGLLLYLLATIIWAERF